MEQDLSLEQNGCLTASFVFQHQRGDGGGGKEHHRVGLRFRTGDRLLAALRADAKEWNYESPRQGGRWLAQAGLTRLEKPFPRLPLDALLCAEVLELAGVSPLEAVVSGSELEEAIAKVLQAFTKTFPFVGGRDPLAMAPAGVAAATAFLQTRSVAVAL